MNEEQPSDHAPKTDDNHQQPKTIQVGRGRLRRPVVILIIFAGLALVAFFVWKAFFTRRPPENVLFLSGRIEGDDSTIAPKTSGRILKVCFREGDNVQAETRSRCLMTNRFGRARTKLAQPFRMRKQT
jgi:hypothetical protein